ncbi:MAG: 2-oxoglutarate and iron-dependent oxygenase domain-containing protein [Chlamydiota bacterium]
MTSTHMKKAVLSIALWSSALFPSLNSSDFSFDATIPVVDMNEYFNPDTKQKFISELSEALKEVGFFAVVNTGVDADVLEQGYQACFDFFAQPADVKFLSYRPEFHGQRGYFPGESAKGDTRIDLKEFYHVGRELPDEDLARLKFWKNIWPEAMDLKTPLMGLFDALQEYMVPLEHALAEAIGAPVELFDEMTREGDVLLRALHYPANPPKNAIWAAEHTDIDLFTILPHATAEGLQVKNKQGEWIDIKVPEGAFIINAGDMLENITNGEFRSGLHRVVAKEDGYERYSIVLFVHPKAVDRLDPMHRAHWGCTQVCQCQQDRTFIGKACGFGNCLAADDGGFGCEWLDGAPHRGGKSESESNAKTCGCRAS